MMEIGGAKLEILTYLARAGEEVQDNEIVEYVEDTLQGQYSKEEVWDSLDYLEEKGLIELTSEGLEVYSKGYTITIKGRTVLRNMRSK